MGIIKVAHTSDNHIGPDRFQENMESLLWMAQDIYAQGCTLTTIGGDFFDKRATENDVWLASRFISALQTDALILLGNHGTVKGMELMDNWQTGSGKKLKVVNLPSIVEMCGLTIYCVPHIDKSNIQQVIDLLGVTASQQAFNEAIISLFEYMAAMSQTTKNNIFVGHFTLQGSKTSTGQELYDPGLSHGFQVKMATMLTLNILLASIGHIHKAQLFETEQFPIFYNGGHSRFNFGETEEKGYFISTIDTDSGKLIDLQFRKNPYAPRLVTEIYQLEGDTWDLVGDEQEFADAEVRVIARYPEGSSPNFTELTEFYDGNCLKYKIEKDVQTVTKTRFQEIVKATTLREQVELYWEHTPDSAPPTEERPQVIAVLDEILEGIDGSHA